MSCLQVCTTVHASLIIVYFSGYLGIIHLVRAQNFPKKLTFYIPWYAHLRVRIRGQKMLDFEKLWFRAMDNGLFYRFNVL